MCPHNKNVNFLEKKREKKNKTLINISFIILFILTFSVFNKNIMLSISGIGYENVDTG